jgi:2-succinyl-6-hydroxy-2,4-cyclohexadiene-1-carboxylate synthase
MNEYVIYPGFLGQKSDFTTLSHSLGTVEIVDPASVYREESVHEISGITSKLLPQTTKIGKRIGIGYSMGGRLLLQLAQKFPDSFDALVFISTNPGLRSEQEKEHREESDLNWAKDLLNLPWDDFLKKWNAQSVFQGTSNEVDRKESHYDKESLARQITNWSLAKQSDFRFYLRVVQTPYLWITGERDLKFSQLAQEILPMDYLPLNGAGHRVHLDQPAELARIILKFAGK